MIDRYQLRYFLAVVETGNFSRAAARVNVTQPTLSVGIAKLERSIGAELFFRNSQRVHLTAAGVRFLDHARAIEREFNAIEAGVAGEAPARLIRVGLLNTLPTEFATTMVQANARAADPDQIELVEGSERELITGLQRRRLDLAVTLIRGGASSLPFLSLFEEGYVMAMADSHKLAGAGELSGEMLADEVMMVRRHCEALSDTSRYFTERGVRPRFSHRSTNDDRVLALVRAGLGVTVTPESLRAPGITQVRLSGFTNRREIGLIFSEHATDLQSHGGGVVAAIRQAAEAVQSGRP